MLRYFLSACAVSLLLTPAFAQRLAADNKTATAPDDILFSFFFRHLSSSESSAKLKGGSESATKRDLKGKVGLTDTEISLVNEMAQSCNADYDAKSRSGGAEVRELAAKYNPKPSNTERTAPPPAVAARIDQLERERAKVITNCLDSLKRSMGAAQYAKLATFVRQTEGPSIRHVEPTQLDPNLKTPQLPGTGNLTNQGGLK